jgi:hypothetical protein
MKADIELEDNRILNWKTTEYGTRGLQNILLEDSRMKGFLP